MDDIKETWELILEGEFCWMEEEKEELWHYKRTCQYCGCVWGGLHCVHDGYQNPCPNCNQIPTVIPLDEDDVCDCEFDF